jgi:hypothetical protein
VIHFGEGFLLILSLSFYPHEAGKASKNVSELKLKQIPSRQ